MIYFDLRRDGGIDEKQAAVVALAAAERTALEAARIARTLANKDIAQRVVVAYKALRDIRMAASRDLVHYKKVAATQGAPSICDSLSHPMRSNAGPTINKDFSGNSLATPAREIDGGPPLLLEDVSDFTDIASLFLGATWRPTLTPWPVNVQGRSWGPLIRCNGRWYELMDLKWRLRSDEEIRSAVWLWLDGAMKKDQRGNIVKFYPNLRSVNNVISALRVVALREDYRDEINGTV